MANKTLVSCYFVKSIYERDTQKHFAEIFPFYYQEEEAEEAGIWGIRTSLLKLCISKNWPPHSSSSSSPYRERLGGEGTLASCNRLILIRFGGTDRRKEWPVFIIIRRYFNLWKTIFSHAKIASNCLILILIVVYLEADAEWKRKSHDDNDPGDAGEEEAADSDPAVWFIR